MGFMFGNNLQRLLNKYGIKQKILADKIFVSQTQISRYLSGENDPPINIAKKIAEYFNKEHNSNITLDWLIGLEYTLPPSEKEKLQPIKESIERGDPDTTGEKFSDEILNFCNQHGIFDMDRLQELLAMCTQLLNAGIKDTESLYQIYSLFADEQGKIDQSIADAVARIVRKRY